MSTLSTIDIIKAKLFGGEATNGDALVAELKDALRSQLKSGVWMVEFTKVDGTPSTMVCTLDQNHIPLVEEDTTKTPHADNPRTLRVYAVDRGGWRSFRVQNLTRIYSLPENL